MGHPEEQLGGKFLLYVNTGSDESTNLTWTKIGGQRKGNFGEPSDIVKAQHKDSFPWYRKVYGYIDWTFDFDGVWMSDDTTGVQEPGISQMQNLWDTQTDAYVKIVTPINGAAAGNGAYYTGHAVIATFSLDGPHDNLITYTGKLEGNGAFVFTE